MQASDAAEEKSMRFAVDEDYGTYINGWVTTDNPSKTSQVIVKLDGTPVSVVEAKLHRADVLGNRLHNTGNCGFVLTEENTPGLGLGVQLELVDRDEGLLIYRRPPPFSLRHKKLFRLETQLVTNARLNQLLDGRFQMVYPGLELLGEETLNWIVRLPPLAPLYDSFYASGRLPIRRFEPLLRDQGYFFAVVMRDPVEELAERLLLAQLVSSRPELGASFRVPSSLGPLVLRTKGRRLTDRQELEAMLGSLEPGERQAVANPAARLLGASSLDEADDPNLLHHALSMLSSFHAVGLRSDLDGFLDLLSAVLETEPLPRLEQQTYSSVSEVAAALRDVPILEELIGIDLELYRTVQEAYAGTELDSV